MNHIDECWMNLAEAIITDGIQAYVRAARSIQSQTERSIRQNNPMITEYFSGKEFILCGCNNLVGEDPETLLANVNAKYGIDAEKIEFLIKRSKGRKKEET